MALKVTFGMKFDKLLFNFRVAYCSELVDYTPSYLQTDKFGLHFGLGYDLW